ncbi:hypothetical protein K438DRAFT_2151800, partial [Mycena galopus ATCC 62051]
MSFQTVHGEHEGDPTLLRRWTTQGRSWWCNWVQMVMSCSLGGPVVSEGRGREVGDVVDALDAGDGVAVEGAALEDVEAEGGPGLDHTAAIGEHLNGAALEHAVVSLRLGRGRAIRGNGGSEGRGVEAGAVFFGSRASGEFVWEGGEEEGFEGLVAGLRAASPSRASSSKAFWPLSQLLWVGCAEARAALRDLLRVRVVLVLLDDVHDLLENGERIAPPPASDMRASRMGWCGLGPAGWTKRPRGESASRSDSASTSWA